MKSPCDETLEQHEPRSDCCKAKVDAYSRTYKVWYTSDPINGRRFICRKCFSDCRIYLEEKPKLTLIKGGKDA